MVASPLFTPGLTTRSITLSFTMMEDITTSVPPSRPPSGNRLASISSRAVNPFNSFCRDFSSELLDHSEWVARQRRTVVRMIFVYKCKRAIRLHAVREVGIAAGHQD